MIPVKLITKEEAEKNGWAGRTVGRSPSILMAAGEDKKGVISIEQIDPETMEIIKKIKFDKKTNKQLLNFDREKHGKYADFKIKNNLI